MSTYDPFRFLEGSILHDADIAIAQTFTGKRGKTISWHLTRSQVRQGVPESEALAKLHWQILGLGLAGSVAGALAWVVWREKR